MALKRIITKLEDVDESLRGLYKEKEGKFFLDLDGEDDDLSGLKNALARVKAENDSLKSERDTAIATAKQKGEDVTALEASYRSKLEGAAKHEKDALQAVQQALKNATFGKTASELALKLGGEKGSALLLPHVEKRLRIELDGENAITRVLDKEGKMSAMSVNDLEKELREDPMFATAITGSRASGAGSSTGKFQGGAPDTGTSFNPNRATPKELAAWIAQRSQNKGE